MFKLFYLELVQSQSNIRFVTIRIILVGVIHGWKLHFGQVALDGLPCLVGGRQVSEMYGAMGCCNLRDQVRAEV